LASSSSDGAVRDFSHEELIKRNKASLEIFWLKDERLEDSENLPAPEVLAAEIVENLGDGAGAVQIDL
jgi:type I restriction enzyme M protein